MFTSNLFSPIRHIQLLKIVNRNIEVVVGSVKNMNDWETEKKRFLKMSIDEKRELYSKYIKLDDIQTWKEYATSKKLLPKVDALPNYKLDHSKNCVLSKKISYFCGDITHLEIDAIVNAANSSLMGGGGVDGAIHRAAGPTLKKECKTVCPCPTGEARITGGYKLPSKYVIHTVGPQGEKTDLLRDCYKNSLKLMLDNKLRTIAFPCISTGIYGYPNLPAAHVAAYTVRQHLEEYPDAVDRVIFCLFMDEDKNIYEGILQSYFPLD